MCRSTGLERSPFDIQPRCHNFIIQPFTMSEPIIQIKDANIYQGTNLILSNVQLTVNKGEFVYLVGKTGSGKSSLLKTLYGELSLTSGEGWVAGFNLRELDWKRVPYLRRNLGVVFQDFQLLTDRNITDNLRFVLRATGWTDEKLIQEKIQDVLDKVGLKSKGFKMPFELSGGEQQRVALARAFVVQPQLLLADEPTGSLDAQTGESIMDLMLSMNQARGTTLILVTHDQKLASRCDRTLTLQAGQLISQR